MKIPDIWKETSLLYIGNFFIISISKIYIAIKQNRLYLKSSNLIQWPILYLLKFVICSLFHIMDILTVTYTPDTILRTSYSIVQYKCVYTYMCMYIYVYVYTHICIIYIHIHVLYVCLQLINQILRYKGNDSNATSHFLRVQYTQGWSEVLSALCNFATILCYRD